tara:strand:- start:307 stop:552 length:246 start_codon:yes stop_codon:yes gene_type:complete
MHKIIKVTKSNLENIIVNEYKDLNLIALQLRSIKMQVDSLSELLESQGITCYGTSNKQVKLNDYIIDDQDNMIMQSTERTY